MSEKVQFHSGGAVALVAVPVFADVDMNDSNVALGTFAVGDFSKRNSGYQLPVKTKYNPTSADEDTYGEVMEIPVAKQIVFKFGKPRKVESVATKW